MNEHPHYSRRPFTLRRLGGVVAVLAGIALFVAACSSGGNGPGVASVGSNSPSPTSSVSAGSAQQNGALAFANCMRSHGVPNWPDPDSNGMFPASAKQISRSNPEFPAAQTACRHLLPNGGNGPTQAQWQQILSTMVSFAHCMRQHGMPNFPDPTYRSGTNGELVFNIRVDPNSPQFLTKIHSCQHLLHNYGSKPGWPDLSNYFQQTH
jgi:hypothetical protein